MSLFYTAGTVIWNGILFSIIKHEKKTGLVFPATFIWREFIFNVKYYPSWIFLVK